MTLRDILIYMFIPWAAWMTAEHYKMKTKMQESAISDKHIYEELGEFKEMLKDVRISQKEMKMEIDSDLKIMNNKLDQLLIDEVKFLKRFVSGDNGPGK